MIFDNYSLIYYQVADFKEGNNALVVTDMTNMEELANKNTLLYKCDDRIVCGGPSASSVYVVPKCSCSRAGDIRVYKFTHLYKKEEKEMNKVKFLALFFNSTQ